jgi:hypothetical protein
MFILLGMLAVAESDLLLLPERRNSGGFHKVHAHDGGFCVLGWMLTLLITTDITPPFAYLFRTLFRLDDAEDALYSHILLNIYVDVRVRWYAAARYLDKQSPLLRRNGALKNANISRPNRRKDVSAPRTPSR